MFYLPQRSAGTSLVYICVCIIKIVHVIFMELDFKFNVLLIKNDVYKTMDTPGAGKIS